MDKNTVLRSKEIRLGVHLDEENIPVSLDWDATDSPITGVKSCKAFMLRIWDDETQQTIQMDLWAKDLSIEEMNHFVFQTLATLGDTYRRATANKESADDISRLALSFAKKNGIQLAAKKK